MHTYVYECIDACMYIYIYIYIYMFHACNMLYNEFQYICIYPYDGIGV